MRYRKIHYKHGWEILENKHSQGPEDVAWNRQAHSSKAFCIILGM